MVQFSITRRLAMAGIVALAATTALTSNAVAETTLERAKREGVLRVGFANEAPWGFMKPDGTLSGEAPDVLTAIAGKLGIERIEGVLVEFGALIPGLQANRFDIIATALFIRPARCEQVAFTNPTVAVGNGFLVRSGNPLGLHSFADVGANPAARLGILSGSVDLQYARDAGIPDDRIVQLPDGASQIEALRADRVDAVSQNGPSIQIYADRTAGEFERALPFTNTEETTGYGAFAVRKDDTDLLDALNTELAGYLGSPEHLALVKDYGVTVDDLPAPGRTAEALCKG